LTSGCGDDATLAQACVSFIRNVPDDARNNYQQLIEPLMQTLAVVLTANQSEAAESLQSLLEVWTPPRAAAPVPRAVRCSVVQCSAVWYSVICATFARGPSLARCCRPTRASHKRLCARARPVSRHFIVASVVMAVVTTGDAASGAAVNVGCGCVQRVAANGGEPDVLPTPRRCLSIGDDLHHSAHWIRNEVPRFYHMMRCDSIRCNVL
jgi:hypothetical protein